MKIPMNELIMPRFPMGLTELSMHVEDVARTYKPLDEEDTENSIAVYKELAYHESWIVVEGALYGLDLMHHLHGVPWKTVRDIISDFQFSHPSKVIRTLVKTLIRLNDRRDL